MKITQTKSLETISKTLKKYTELIAGTYGPAGKKILIAHNEFSLKAVDDGFEGSKEMEIENEFENAVLMYIKESTKKTNDKAGDGTTTAGLLTSAIFNESLGDTSSAISTLKPNYHKEVEEVKQGVKEAVAYIKDKAKKIKTKQELYKIAYNSYNNEAIATLISDTLFKIGSEGLIAIEDSQTAETELEMVEGLEIEKGYLSPYFINTDKEEATIQNPYILTINGRVDNFSQIVPLLQKIQTERRIAIFAESFGEDALNKSILIRSREGFSIVLVETPGFGENKLENLKDISVVSGSVIVDFKTLKAEEISPAMLGSAKKVVVRKDKTLIISGAGDKKEINKRADFLATKAEKINAPYEKDQLNKHIASLRGGMAVIKVGANTENEQKAIKAKVEDSINSTKLAFKDGIVKGGGKTYAEIKTSSPILNRALKYPLKQLEENGKEYLDENVTDPAGVLIIALETASSIATGLLEIGAIITTKREEKEVKF